MLVALMLAAAALAGPPAAAAPPPPPSDEEQFATDRDPVDRMTVDTRVDGQGPYPFTVDTGANRSVVSDRLAASLALPAGRPLKMHGITGLDTVESVQVSRLAVGRSEQRDIAVPVLRERALGAAGLLGLDALANKRVVLDFRSQKMTVRSSASSQPVDPAEPGTIVVTARSRFGQLILTDVTLHGHKVYAIIDTGAQNTIGNSAFRALLARKGELAAIPTLIYGVTGHTTAADLVAVPSLTVGGLTIKNMQVAFADVHTFAVFKVDQVPALLIGMDLLRLFDRVAIDFRRRQIQFDMPTGQADSATQLASESSRPGVSSCGSACAAPPGG